MDAFGDGMTARGPTLAADRETWTGSLHIVDLPDEDAVDDFVTQEPYNRAGLFGEHLVRGFENRLGRTVWEFPQGSVDPLFLLIAHLRDDEGRGASMPSGTALPTGSPEGLVVHGELRTLGETAPAGVVLALRSPTRSAVEALLESDGLGLGERFDVEVHDWEIGGRR